LSQPDYVPPSATPTSDRHPVKMTQNGPPAESLNNRQQENEDFGGHFCSSLSLAYGDDDDTGNTPQPDYSLLESESGLQSSPESPMAASNSSSTCTNCEQLKRQIDVLKRNQMPGTHSQLLTRPLGVFWHYTAVRKLIFKSRSSRPSGNATPARRQVLTQ